MAFTYMRNTNNALDQTAKVPPKNISDGIENVVRRLDATKPQIQNTIRFTYVESDKISPDLICSICCEPFFEPIMHMSCQNVFCKKCVEKVSNCPLCREAITQQQFGLIPRFMKNALDEIRVICPICTNSIQRGKFTDHFNKCPADCPFGCKAKIALVDLEQHEKEYTEKPIPCDAADVGCEFKSSKKLMSLHSTSCVFF